MSEHQSNVQFSCCILSNERMTARWILGAACCVACEARTLNGLGIMLTN